MSTVYRNIDELKAALDNLGELTFEGDVEIRCEVPYEIIPLSVHVGGNLILQQDFSIMSSLDVEKSLDFTGRKLEVGGDLSVEKGLYAVYGGLEIGHDLYIGRDASIGGDVQVAEDVEGGGFLSIGGNLTAHRLFWSHAAMPDVVGRMEIDLVLPPEWQRGHWEKRLGMELGGCYADIVEKIAPHLEDRLRYGEWSETEWWILETAQKYALKEGLIS